MPDRSGRQYESRFAAFVLRLIAAASIFVLGGCTTLGPDFKTPASNWLDHWELSLHGLADTEQPDTELDEATFWNGLFNDPVLQQLIAEAQRANPQLRIAALRIFESRALQGMAGSSLYPQLQQLTGSATHVESRNHEMSSTRSLGSYQGGFNIGWELDFWGRFQRSIESADAAFFASVENQRAIQVLINARITDLYFSYQVTQARIRIARKNAEIQKRSFNITTEQFNSGNTSELDVQQAKTQYLSTLAAIPALEQTLVQIRNALSVLLGRAPGNLKILDDPNYELPKADSAKVAILPSKLLLRRPDVHAAAWLVAAQSARIGIAEADFYPSISLLGTLGWAGSSIATAGTSTLALGPAIKWNLFDHGFISNNIRVQDARLEQLIEAYQNTVLQAAAEVDNAAIAVLKSAERIALLEESVKSAERALEIANTNYKEGYAGFQRVLDAQRALFGQTDRLISTRGDNISAIIALYKGLGGGWRPRQASDLLPDTLRQEMKQRVDWGELLDSPLASPPDIMTQDIHKEAP
ncbi:efflux transporter outer membrane subunit [Thiolapillus brandeum]|uniref:Multidrug efflux pump outer membrane lipoprotein n=1 Tax=Thiolapillus brandeum TaxID=1076588 RepID=A0A7U6GI23_9GAMM|nr:TolC family protein [Thiolapillus brandeum]BAO44036.1 multidrug efflux pump outer membrane lipoprotein [Thiolapillus brandeum]